MNGERSARLGLRDRYAERVHADVTGDTARQRFVMDLDAGECGFDAFEPLPRVTFVLERARRAYGEPFARDVGKPRAQVVGDGFYHDAHALLDAAHFGIWLELAALYGENGFEVVNGTLDSND